MEKFGLSKVLEGLDAKAYQSFQTITFHYQIDALGSISELKAPELLKHYVSVSNRCPESHFGAQGAQKAARALKALLIIIKLIRCETFRGILPEGYQSSQAIIHHPKSLRAMKM